MKKPGLTATVGIGTNLYLAKIAMDISAKHNADRIAYLNEDLYRQTLWHHTPMTEFLDAWKRNRKKITQIRYL